MVGLLTCDYIQYGSYGYSGYINLMIFVVVFTIHQVLVSVEVWSINLLL